MTLLVLAIPVPEADVGQHRRFIADLTGPRRAELVAARQHAGLRERSYVQPMPNGGHMFIATFESDDLDAAMKQMASATDGFSRWFRKHPQEVTGICAAGGTSRLPELVIDSGPVQTLSQQQGRIRDYKDD